MSAPERSADWSAIPGTARTGSRTAANRRPPRHDWDRSDPRPSWWQLTTELLLDPEGEPLSEEQRELVSAAQRAAFRLGRLVDDLLVLAQLQSRSLRVERSSVDVPAAVADAIDEVSRGTPTDV